MADATSVAASDHGDAWTLTLIHGKQTFAVAFEPQHPQRIARLKHEVEQRTGVASKYQRLIYRGKELLEEESGTARRGAKKPAAASRASAAALVPNAKIMLLLNRTYHEETAKRSGEPPQSTVAVAKALPPAATKQIEAHTRPAAAVATTASIIDMDALDDDEVLVQALRGKAVYEFALKRDATVFHIKQRVSAILGLASTHGVRLVVKGQTPADATALGAFVTTSSSDSSHEKDSSDHSSRKSTNCVIKCMVLLHGQQHAIHEKEDELRQLLNELTLLTIDARRTEKHVARNFASREETLVRVAALVDSAQRVLANLELLCAHLQPSGRAAAALEPRALAPTAAVLAQAIEDASVLCASCAGLLQRVTL